MSQYTGYFKDINDKSYKVVIDTSEGNDIKDITLSTDPFTTEIETSDSHLFKPCKYSSATVRIVADDYMFDLYASTAQANKVTLYQGDSIKWVGYVTPNLYSMGYESVTEEIEVEAIDALSTLQYYDYKPINSSKEIVTFKDILDYLLKRCNAYTEYYVSANIQLSISDKKLIDNLYISEQDFFDEDDEAMTMQEVLEEICKYFGMTCVADADKVYFFDYEAIKAGLNDYYKYSLIDNSSPTLVTLSDEISIDGNDYAENGQQISLDNVYNKATVKDSLYSFESIIPSIWDEDYLENYGGDWAYTQEVNEEFDGQKYKCFFKYYKNKNYKSYYYNKTTRQPVELSTINYKTTQDYIGATICQHFSEKVTDYNTKYNDIGYTDYVLLHLHDKQSSTQMLKMFELEVNDVYPSFLGGSTYLIIKGNFLFLDRENEMYIIQGYSNKNDDFDPSRLYIKCSVSIGDKYWNGTSWVDSFAGFNLYFDNNGQTDHCINQTFPVKNNITWDMGLDGEEGYAIPMPNTNEVITGKPKFILYEPQRLDNSYRCDAVWLSNFDIIAKVQNFEKQSEKDSDTEYSNVINEEFVNKLDDIEFKVCTWDSKEANYSAVAVKNNDGTFNFIDTVFNQSTKNQLRFEEHLIYKIVTQYETPSAVLNLNLKNIVKLYSTLTDKYLDGKVFIVDSISEKYADAKQEVKLIEKK